MAKYWKHLYRCKKCNYQQALAIPIGMSWLHYVQREEFVQTVCSNCGKHYVSGGGNKE